MAPYLKVTTKGCKVDQIPWITHGILVSTAVQIPRITQGILVSVPVQDKKYKLTQE